MEIFTEEERAALEAIRDMAKPLKLPRRFGDDPQAHRQNLYLRANHIAASIDDISISDRDVERGGARIDQLEAGFQQISKHLDKIDAVVKRLR
jgi:hypothetical protein